MKSLILAALGFVIASSAIAVDEVKPWVGAFDEIVMKTFMDEMNLGASKQIRNAALAKVCGLSSLAEEYQRVTSEQQDVRLYKSIVGHPRIADLDFSQSWAALSAVKLSLTSARISSEHTAELMKRPAEANMNMLCESIGRAIRTEVGAKK